MEGKYILARYLLLGFILAIASWQDLRYRQIFWPLPAAGIFLAGAGNLLMGELTVREVGGGLLLGLLLILVSILSRNAIGMGDALLVAFLGTALGFGEALLIFWFASFAAAGLGLFAWRMGRGKERGNRLRNYALPFAPVLSLTGLVIEVFCRILPGLLS